MAPRPLLSHKHSQSTRTYEPRWGATSRSGRSQQRHHRTGGAELGPSPGRRAVFRDLARRLTSGAGLARSRSPQAARAATGLEQPILTTSGTVLLIKWRAEPGSPAGGSCWFQAAQSNAD